MRSFIFYVLLYLLSPLLYAQENKVTWSAVFSEAEKGNVYQLISGKGQVFVTSVPATTAQVSMKKDMSNFQVRVLDENLKQVCATTGLQKPASIANFNSGVTEIFAKDGSMDVCASSFDSKAKTAYSHLLKYSDCKLQPGVIDLKAIGAGANVGDETPGVELFKTNRADRMVLWADQHINKGMTTHAEGMVLLDENYNPLYSKKIELSLKPATLSTGLLIAGVFVDAEDNVVVVMSDAAGIKQTFFEVFKFSKGGETKRNRVLVEEVDMETNDFHLLADGMLGCAGFYSKKGPSMGPINKGAFYLKVNPESGARVSGKFQMLNELKDSPVKSELATNGEVMLREILWTKTDDVIMIAETHKASSMNVTDAFYYEFYVLKFNAEAQYQWGTIIPKKQVVSMEESSAGRFFSSFGILMGSGKVYVLYNAHPSDSETDAKSVKNYETSRTALASIDVASGKLERHSLSDNGVEGMVTVPMLFSKGSKEGELFIVRANKYEKPMDFSKLKYQAGKIQLR